MELISNWNNYPKVNAEVFTTDHVPSVQALVRTSKTIIARGNGRSYGDASLHDVVFNSLLLNRIIHFDEKAGTIEVESGILFARILEHIVPVGFFLPVVPGTKYITVGGAIAADIHGKNHCITGSISRHIVSLTLCIEDGTILTCSPTENSDLFYTTCGGMGLTGVILSATLKLMLIETMMMKTTLICAQDFDSLFEVYEKNISSHYIATWLDVQSFKDNRITSVTDLATHLLKNELPGKKQIIPLNAGWPPVNIPSGLNGILLNPMSIKVYNTYHFYKSLFSKKVKIEHSNSFLFPLDSIRNWNELYGTKGMLQYQFVIPLSDSQLILKKIFNEVNISSQPVYLAVMKRLAAADPRSVMSFPMEGYTVSMDFKRSTEVFSLLDRLDHIVADAGGRIYLAKDARMNKYTFKKTYPTPVHHGHFKSHQSSRLQD